MVNRIGLHGQSRQSAPKYSETQTIASVLKHDPNTQVVKMNGDFDWTIHNVFLMILLHCLTLLLKSVSIFPLPLYIFSCCFLPSVRVDKSASSNVIPADTASNPKHYAQSEHNGAGHHFK